MPKSLVYFVASPCSPSQGITLASSTLNASTLNLLVFLTLLLGRHIDVILAGNRSKNLGKENCFLSHFTHSENI